MYETRKGNLSVVVVLLVVGLVGAWFVFSKNKIVSPVPEEEVNNNSRRVIFISPKATPTNEPTSTPSATLKPTKKRIPTNTPKPTKKLTTTPTATTSPAISQ